MMFGGVPGPFSRAPVSNGKTHVIRRAVQTKCIAPESLLSAEQPACEERLHIASPVGDHIDHDLLLELALRVFTRRQFSHRLELGCRRVVAELDRDMASG